MRMNSIGLDGGERWTLHFLVGRGGFACNGGSHDTDRCWEVERGRDCVESSSRKLPK